MVEILSKAKIAQKMIANLTPKIKENIIKQMAIEVANFKDEIIKANEIDIKNAHQNSLNSAMIERLHLDNKKIDQITVSLEQTAILPDPVGRILDGWVNHAGLKFQKVTIPIGVVCVIYESRPNVTAEVASLCLKSGNASILKGGKEAINSNLAIIAALHKALECFNVDKEAIVFLSNFDKNDTAKLIQMNRYIDVVIPRGGSGLINFVTQNSTIPVIKHDKGICHIFVDESANLDDALKICLNAKVQKPSACNAVETILVNKKIGDFFIQDLANKLKNAGVRIYGCEKTAQIIECKRADEESFSTEYLDLALNLKVVDSLDEAIIHIDKFGSNHSEAIISQRQDNIERFLNELNSSCLYVNASTRFSDGYEFGFGAEVGISTNKLHARGPMGLDELTTYKYKIIGSGQVRK